MYLALTKLRKADAKAIYKSATVARQDIYRILAGLQEKGLVEKVVATPAEFKAVPIEWCVPILVEHIKNMLSENERVAANTLRKLNENSENGLIERESKFTLVPKNTELFCRSAKELIENTHKNIDMAITSKRLRFIITLFSEEFKRALERGVKFRIITEHNENVNLTTKSLKALRHPLFEIKHLPSHREIPTSTWISDSKRMFIVTSEMTSASCEVSSLWTDNPQITAELQDYFESLWSKTQKSTREQIA